MEAAQSQPWFHSTRYPTDVACKHCNSVTGHEIWCIARNAAVRNAFEAVLDSAKLALHDHLILDALGVAWQDLSFCKGTS